MRKDEGPAEQPVSSPLSLSRLREAFTAMLGPQERPPAKPSESSEEAVPSTGRAGPIHVPQGCEINPRSVVEAILFVGRPDNRPFSSRELAAAMRGVSPLEIDAVVRDLKSVYEKDDAPYQIVEEKSGYRLALRKQFERIRDKFYGRAREARLSPAAVEVLSIIVYNQPITADEINRHRNASNGAAIATLVGRRLVRLERSAEDDQKPCYTTTDRFLKLFGLENLDALPRSEELDGY